MKPYPSNVGLFWIQGVKVWSQVLDSGYITERVFKSLNLPIEEEHHLSVFTFGSKIAQELESPLVRSQISTKTGGWLELFVNVVPMITDGVAYPKDFLEVLKDEFELADDGSLMNQVDMLIGNDYFDKIMSTKKIEIQENVFLIESQLGWILSGKPVKGQDDTILTVHTYFQTHLENKLTQPDLPLEGNTINLKSLWELESIGITDSPKSCRDEEAIKRFNETTEIINDRYTVSWPWIEYPPTLPSNYGIAYGRLVALLKRLDTEALSKYNETLEQQLELGIIEPVSKPEDPLDHPVYYHPHHGVIVEGLDHIESA
ncbi:putative peptidase (DUF1758) domain-containing protein [Phthorimaea operculella]|nr:putative peptidase (DUF1758) domain-containing protein [Phthorimaea operculella]